MKLKFLKFIIIKFLFKWISFLFWKNNVFQEVYIVVSEINSLPSLLQIIKNTTFLSVKCLTDICVVDFPQKKNRFEIIYNLLSLKFNFRIFIKLKTIMFLESISNLYNNSNWIEREIRDLFGIYFTNHPDLRRILTDHGFKGYPLRRDFPLTGYIELRYDDTKMHLVYEPVELTQNFRIFTFTSPWEQLF